MILAVMVFVLAMEYVQSEDNPVIASTHVVEASLARITQEFV
jgi:hypothetical protein